MALEARRGADLPGPVAVVVAELAQPQRELTAAAVGGVGVLAGQGIGIVEGGAVQAVAQAVECVEVDGPFVEAGENDNLIVQRLQADANAVGIFGYSFLYENMDTLKAVDIAGVSPSEETIGDFSYPVSRPLFFYVKNAHRGVIPNLDEFIAEYMSDDALEPGGYLSERGLVSLSADRLTALQDAVLDGAPMSAPE